MGVLRRAYVEVLPDTDGFDSALTAKLKAADPGGKSGKLIGKQLGGQLNLALARLDLPAIDIKADPKTALAALEAVEAKLHAMSGDAATVEVKVQTEKALGQLARFRKQLGDAGSEGGAEAAAGFASRFGANLGPLVSKTGASPQVLAAGAAIGAVLAAPAAALLSAAVIGGAGIGGVVGGVMLAAKDPRVQAAVASMSERIQARLTAAGKSFVGPVLAGMDQIDHAIAKIDIEGVLVSASRFVKPLADGISSAMVDLGDGIANLIKNAGPVIDEIGKGIADIGRHLGAGLTMLSQNGPAAAHALSDLFRIITDGIDAAFTLVDALTKIYEVSRKIGGDWSLRGWLKTIGGDFITTSAGARKVGSGTFAAAQGIDAMKSASAAANGPQKALVGTLTTAEKAALGERSAMVALSNQLRAQTNPAFALIEAQKQLKTAQDRAAEATRKHGKNSDEARTATRQLALAAIDMQAKAGALSNTFNGRLSPSMRTTLQAAGLTQRQIDAVAREFRDAKKDGDRYAKRYQASATLTGNAHVSQELARLNAIQQALKSGNPLTAGTINKAIRNVLGPQINRARGGPINGPGTETSDDIPAMLSKNEYVVRAASAKKIGRAGMDYLNKYGELPLGLADGGQVQWPFPTTAARAWVPSQAWAMSRVMPPGPPSGGATDDWIVRTVKAHFPGLNYISKFRPGAMTLTGNRSYHSMHRAVDWPASHALAQWWHNTYMARTKELITPWNNLNIHNGRPHRYTGAVWNQHNFAGGNAHDHIAMAGGGVIREPVRGVGVSGRSYSFGERGPETVTPGVGGHQTYNINIAVPVGAHPAEVGRQTVAAIQAFERSNGSRWRQ